MVQITTEQKEQINGAFSENAIVMMKKRYLLDLGNGAQETPADMYKRVAEFLAKVELRYGKTEEDVSRIAQDFFGIMARKEYTPGGRTLTNAGTETPVIPNCVVLPIHDSMESIFHTLKDAALLQQAGCGLGFDFSELRPANSQTRKSRGRASGPVSFLRVYDAAFGTIKQQGRHGANMAMLRVDHPDVLDFIDCKKKEGDIRNFNISVTMTDEFMRLAEENPSQLWECEFNGKKMKPRRVVRHPNGSVAETEEVDVTVGEIFEKLTYAAWTNGEPGIAFLDTWNRANPLPGLGPLASTNPCGEQTLHPYDNCNLGSINLAEFVRDKQVEWKRLRKVTRTAVRLMDNVIDVFDFPVEECTKTAQANRRIGLGIMGFADMLYQLRIRYDSPEGVAMGEKVMKFINEESYKISQELAEEKGVFPNYEKSIFAVGGTHSSAQDPGIGKKMRNAALTTVAPTGSISMSFDTSSGMEPNFALAYIKQDKDGHKYQYMNKYLWEALDEAGVNDQEKERIRQEVIEKGTVKHVEGLPEEVQNVFVVAMDISGRGHMDMQAAFQRHVDNSISKTINFPNSATQEEIADSFISGWKAGCKSLTVYRDGSRVIQVLNVGNGDNIKAPTDIVTEEETLLLRQQEKTQEKAKENNQERVVHEHKPRPRPEVMSGKTYKIKTGYGTLFVTVNNDEQGKPFEVFTTIGKSGGYFQEQSEAMGRLISLALRSNIPAEQVVDHLKGIRGPMPVFTEKGTVLSLPDAIGKILEGHIKNTEYIEDVVKQPENQEKLPFGETRKSQQIADFGFMPGCPDCGAQLVLGEGCFSCKSCGFSRCS
ncbi:MAG: adenosylcobalamin-dependent ribonucleoside-diphosphate reductase [bacterium]|nr:adenosylcobalamin-dependent ribonucleoside-diphosphate reductase [bacterium]